MAGREQVIQRLNELQLPYEITEHPPVYTIEEMDALNLPYAEKVVKNLFLRDYKGKRHFLVVLAKNKKADLKELASQLCSTPLSFASPQRLQKYLCLEKGAVTPLGMINDVNCAVEVVFDRDLADQKVLGVHPNENTATVWISYENLLKFAESCNHTVHLITI